jgi:hypothetical protein
VHRERHPRQVFAAAKAAERDVSRQCGIGDETAGRDGARHERVDPDSKAAERPGQFLDQRGESGLIIILAPKNPCLGSHESDSSVNPPTLTPAAIRRGYRRRPCRIATRENSWMRERPDFQEVR